MGEVVTSYMLKEPSRPSPGEIEKSRGKFRMAGETELDRRRLPSAYPKSATVAIRPRALDSFLWTLISCLYRFGYQMCFIIILNISENPSNNEIEKRFIYELCYKSSNY